MSNILLIEDQDDIARVYKMGLEQAGHTVSVAKTGQIAIASVQAQLPDVMILDMLMPGVSGMDVLRQLQPAQNLPNTKVIVLSNTESPKIREEAESFGISKYCLKVEYTPRQLADLIESLV